MPKTSTNPYLSIVKHQDEFVMVNTLDLSKNQIKLIKDILQQKDLCKTLTFLDIKPFLKDNNYLKLTKNNDGPLESHYKSIFTLLSQSICKLIAKEWIKNLCPRKQAVFPYKYPETPDWWPDCVPHIEPDHLDKQGRIELLISIIRHESADLTKLKSCLNGLDFTSQGHRGAVVLEYEQAFPVIYELFYLSLYERLFLKSGIDCNLQLINELSTEETAILQNSPAIYIKVSNLDSNTSIRLIRPDDINQVCYKIKSSNKDLLNESQNFVTEPEEVKFHVNNANSTTIDNVVDEDTHTRTPKRKFATQRSTHKKGRQRTAAKTTDTDNQQKKKDSIVSGLKSPFAHPARNNHGLFQDNDEADQLDMSAINSITDNKSTPTRPQDLSLARIMDIESYKFKSDTLDINGSEVKIKLARIDQNSGGLDITRVNRLNIPLTPKREYLPPIQLKFLDDLNSNASNTGVSNSVTSTSTTSSVNSSGFSTPIPATRQDEVLLKPLLYSTLVMGTPNLSDTAIDNFCSQITSPVMPLASSPTVEVLEHQYSDDNHNDLYNECLFGMY